MREPMMIEQLVTLVLEPLQTAELRQLDWNVEAIKKIASDSQVEQLVALLALYIQERLLDVLVADKEISQLLGTSISIIKLSKSMDWIKWHSLAEVWKSRKDRSELLFHFIPEAGVPSIIELLSGNFSFKELLRKLNQNEWDSLVVDLFPLTRCLEMGRPFDKINQLVEPLRTILQIKKYSIQAAKPIKPIAPNVHVLVRNYLDTTKPNYLANSPPSSMLRLNSDTIIGVEHLWGIKVLGKYVGQSLILCGMESSPSFRIIEYGEFCPIVRQKGIFAPTPTPSPYQHLGEYLEGLTTATRNYALVKSNSSSALLKNIIPEVPNNRFAGLLLGLGILGKFESLSPIEMLALLSIGDSSSEAAALVGLGASTIGQCNAHLIKLLFVNINRRADDTTKELLQVSGAVRLVSPLALGLAMAGSGDPSCSNLLFRLITKSHELEKPPFDVDTFVLYCGIALALINREAPICGLHPYNVQELLTLVLSPKRHCSGLTRSACLLALCGGLAKGIRLEEIFSSLWYAISLESFSFSEVLLARTILKAFIKTDIESDYFIELAGEGEGIISDQKSGLDVETLLFFAADCLAAGLCTFSKGECREDVIFILIKVAEHLLIRDDYKRPVLDYSTRYRRLIISTCYDIIILGGCLMQAGTGHEGLLRLQSQSFSQSLDYCLGRSIIHSLSLAILALDPNLLTAFQGYPSAGLLKFFILCSILPVPPIGPAMDPSTLIRHFLLHIPLRNLQLSPAIIINPTDKDPLKCLKTWLESHQGFPILSKIISEVLQIKPPTGGDILKDLMTEEDVIRMARVYCIP